MINDNDILFFKNDFSTAQSALDDFGLMLTGLYVSFPEAKTVFQEVPFSSNVIDQTELRGDVYYNRREMTLTFDFIGDFALTVSKISELANYLHGQNMKIVDTEDSAYFYTGRLAVDKTKTDPVVGHVTITGTIDPYKYELQSSVDDWLWDSFSFEDGIIREYTDIQISGSRTLTIYGLRKVVIPVIISSAAMSVSFAGKTYQLKAGNNKVYGIKLAAGNNELTFTGTGTVSVEYRGGSL